MNGDVLTALDYSELFRVHQESGNLFTIATHRRVVRSDYGVIYEDGVLGDTRRVIGYTEKPEIPYTVSMGIYVVEPKVLEYIEPNVYFDVPDLVLRLLDAGEQVGSYLTDSYWLDIGRHDDYEKAIAEYEQLKHLLLREEAAAAMEAG
jgi:NDP-mannose synthase